MGRGIVQRGQQRQVVVAQAPRTPSENENRLLAEWEARGGAPQFAGMLLSWFSAGNTPAADPAATDPGRWLEVRWRMLMRELGMAGFNMAEAERGFRDADKPGSRKEREQLQQQVQEEAARAAGGMSETHKRVLEQLHGADPRAMAKYLSTYLSTAVLSRPHGFSSVGHVQADTALGRLLLHGLHVFLATFHDPSALMRLHLKHHRSVAISSPAEELLQYCVSYGVGQIPSTFTGALPPGGAQVPLFDHLSLHWQLKVVADVMAGLVVPGDGSEDASSSLTLSAPDSVYHWAAFNKLLLLGMYAPVEEAAAPEQQRQLAVGQLQQLATAREAEALSAVGAMQQSMTQFRCVLHEQLQGELAVGQAALQLFAAQQQPELLKQLQQQLQACHLPTLWAHASSGSSSSSGTGSDLQQGQQLVLLVCSLLAWQVAINTEVASQLAPPPQQQQQDEGQGSPSEQAGVQQKAQQMQQMQQLLDAVMSGIGSGAAQHSSAAHAPRDVREHLSRSLGFGAAGQTGRQQQQRGDGEQPQQQTDELLISWLLQLLLIRGQKGAGTQAGGPSTGDCQAAGSSSGADAGGGPTGRIVDALHLQPFTRGVCHVLLVRLLSSAPPCEAWSWNACLSVLRLLVSMERAANAAGGAQYAKDAGSRYTLQELSSPSSSSSSSCGSSQAGPAECQLFDRGRVEVYPELCMQELLSMMHLLGKADRALQDCQKNGNDSSGRESGSSRSDSTARQQQQQQQQEVLQQVSEPNFWRSQALSLYKRKGGFAWLDSFFADATADNDKPGFWGLVGRFAAADQLNLCHADEPVAVAAVPCILSDIDPNEAASVDRLGQRVILGRQLARVANVQLLTQMHPLLQVGGVQDGSPVQPLALHSLLTCALTAAQQPQPLAYASVTPSKMQSAAAVAAAAATAAAAARRPKADGDGDTFYSPCASLEPGAAAAAAAGPGDSAAAAAATAEAAADVWEEGWGFHLGSLLALGPLFDESQQRPCLARFMQLLLQYHEDTAAAASAALQRLTPELQRQRLWVPKAGAGSSSSSSSKAGTGGSSGGAGFVPAERSRLLVLLMGLYHLQMLEEQEARQQEQQWKQAQQQREEEWGRAHGVELGAQQPQQQQQQQTDGQRQQRQHLRMLRTPSGGAAAAAGSAGQSAPAGTTDVYHNTGLRSVIVARVVDAAYGMRELLLYCLAPVEELSTRSSSGSSSRHAGAADGHRLQVCGISHALLHDGAMLLAQPVPGGLPAGAVCDRCSVHSALQSTTLQLTNPLIELMAGRMAPPPAASRYCTGCSGAAYWCSDCAASGAVLQQHWSSCAAAGGGLQQAWADILRVLISAGAVVSDVKTYPTADSVLAEGCCSCRACQDVLADRFDRLVLRWLACPMLQYSGPWASSSTAHQPGPQQQPQQQQSGLLPQALDAPAPLPPVLARARECIEAGRFLQRPDLGLLEHARAPLQQMFMHLRMARDFADLKEQEAGRGSKTAASPFPPPPWAAAAKQPSPKGSPAAKARAPAGLKTPLERKHRQQQKQRQQAGGGMWGGGGMPGLDPELEQLMKEYGMAELSELD